MSHPDLLLNQAIRYRLEGPDVVADDPVTGRAMFLKPIHLAALELLAGANVETADQLEPIVVERLALTAEQARRLVSSLETASLIVQSGDENAGINRWLERGWRHALFFHRLTETARFIEHEFRPGDWRAEALAVLEDYERESPMPARRVPEVEEWIALRRDHSPAGAPLADVLLRRRTCRAFDLSWRPTRAEIEAWIDRSIGAIADTRRTIDARVLDGEMAWAVGQSYVSIHAWFGFFACQGIPDGLYFLDEEGWRLGRVRSGTFRSELHSFANGQVLDSANVVALVTSYLPEIMWRYRTSRAFRKVFVDCGALGQRMLVAAEAGGWSGFVTPATQDSNIESLFGVDGYDEVAMYLVGVGCPRPSTR